MKEVLSSSDEASVVGRQGLDVTRLVAEWMSEGDVPEEWLREAARRFGINDATLPRIKRVPDLLASLDAPTVGAVLQALSKFLPSASVPGGGDPGWDSDLANNIRRNLGVWYSVLTFVSHYVHRYQSTRLSRAIERRMHGVAREALRWLPGSFVAHVVAYFRPRGSLAADYFKFVTCVTLPVDTAKGEASRLPEVVRQFDLQLTSYFQKHGSSLRDGPQVLPFATPGDRRARLVARDTLTHAYNPIRSITLPATGRGDEVEYKNQLRRLLHMMSWGPDTPDINEFNVVQLASGTDTMRAGAPTEAAAHLYVAQLARRGFREFDPSEGALGLTRDYEEAFREALSRVAIDHLLGEVTELSDRAVSAAQRQVREYEMMSDGFRRLEEANLQSQRVLTMVRMNFEKTYLDRIDAWCADWMQDIFQDNLCPRLTASIVGAHNWDDSSGPLIAAALLGLVDPAAAIAAPDARALLSAWESFRMGQGVGSGFPYRDALARTGILRAPLERLNANRTIAGDRARHSVAALSGQIFKRIRNDVTGDLQNGKDAVQPIGSISVARFLLAIGASSREEDEPVLLSGYLRSAPALPWRDVTDGLRGVLTAWCRHSEPAVQGELRVPVLGPVVSGDVNGAWRVQLSPMLEVVHPEDQSQPVVERERQLIDALGWKRLWERASAMAAAVTERAAPVDFIAGAKSTASRGLLIALGISPQLADQRVTLRHVDEAGDIEAYADGTLVAAFRINATGDRFVVTYELYPPA